MLTHWLSSYVELSYDQRKDEVSYRKRGISFNQQNSPGQRVFVVEIDGYAYCVPYEASGTTYHLKTVYPNRRFKHLIQGAES